MVGFAAETENVLELAAVKRDKKALDILVANRVGAGNEGFNAADIEAAIFTPSETPAQLVRQTKVELSERLMDAVAAMPKLAAH